MSKVIVNRLNKYVEHKTYTIVNRVYLAIMDKIFAAENYDEFEMDKDNNIYVTYSLKKEELIISEAQDIIIEQIIKKYRKKLENMLEEEGYYVEYEDSDIHVYFEEPLNIKDDNSDVSSIKLDQSGEHNILIYKKNNIKEPIVKATLVDTEEDDDSSKKSAIFDFGDCEN